MSCFGVQADRSVHAWRRRTLAGALGIMMLSSSLPGCTKDESEFPQQRTPVLETVVSGDRVVPQDPDAAFAALPTPGRIHIRVQADWSTNIVVSVDGQDLPRREGRSDNEAWFEPRSQVLSTASRKLFWDIDISVPPEKRGSDGPVAVEVRDNTFLTTPPPMEKRPPLTVQLINVGKPGRPPLASDFFNEAQGDNTKEDGRAKSQVIAKGVVLAGWLWEGYPDGSSPSPDRNDSGEGQLIRANESEDYHYDFWLDNDFIARNYGSPVNLQPIRDAIVKGARTHLIDLRPGYEFSLLNRGRINAASFLWPGNGGLFTVELNAWHIADRGEPLQAGPAESQPNQTRTATHGPSARGGSSELGPTPPTSPPGTT